jgi:SAM-dependent methyltransferase
MHQGGGESVKTPPEEVFLRTRCGIYDPRVSSSPLLTSLAAAVLHVGDPERILQIECGKGEGVLFLSREFPSARIRGIDRSAEAIHAATGRVGLDPEGRVAFKQGAPRSLPFPDDHFDLLAAIDTLPVAAEAARVLRPGGFLALAGSHGREAPAGFRGKLLRRRLARLGFEAIWTEAAGDGSFSVLRLRGGGAPGLAL